MEPEADYETQHATIFRYAYRLAGSVEDAQDVAQECFLRLHETSGRGAGVVDPRAWLFRVATNLCLDILRRRRVQLETGGPTDDEYGSAPADQYAAVVAHERRRLARRVLARLRQRDRVLLTLWAGGRSHAEIAEITGLRRGSVGRLLDRATRRAVAVASKEVKP